MSAHQLILAPLRGVTIRLYREVWARHFSGLDLAVSPFIPLVTGSRVKPGLLTEVVPTLPHSIPLVPQVIGRDPAALSVMLKTLRDLGYTRADLNAGCPWPMVVRRGRGAGLANRPADLRQMLASGCQAMPDGFSVKLRLGIDSPDSLLQLMPLLNEFPLHEVVIHPRTARQMYDGSAHIGHFAAAFAACRHPVVYNGDIRTPADLTALQQRFPTITRWMIGRGVAADPFLPARLCGDTTPRDLTRLRAFLDDLLDTNCATLSGQRPVLGRMKELWYYMAQPLRGGAQTLKRIQHSATLDEYRCAVDDWFAATPGWKPDTNGIDWTTDTPPKTGEY